MNADSESRTGELEVGSQGPCRLSRDALAPQQALSTYHTTQPSDIRSMVQQLVEITIAIVIRAETLSILQCSPCSAVLLVIGNDRRRGERRFLSRLFAFSRAPPNPSYFRPYQPIDSFDPVGRTLLNRRWRPRIRLYWTVASRLEHRWKYSTLRSRALSFSSSLTLIVNMPCRIRRCVSVQPAR